MLMMMMMMMKTKNKSASASVAVTATVAAVYGLLLLAALCSPAHASPTHAQQQQQQQQLDSLGSAQCLNDDVLCYHPKTNKTECCEVCCGNICCRTFESCNLEHDRCEVKWGQGGALAVLLMSVFFLIGLVVFLIGKHRSEAGIFAYRHHAAVNADTHVAEVTTIGEIRQRVAGRGGRSPLYAYLVDGKNAVPPCSQRFWTVLRFLIVVVLFFFAVGVLLFAIVEGMSKGLDTRGRHFLLVTFHNIVHNIFMGPALAAGLVYGIFEGFRTSSDFVFSDFWFGFSKTRYGKMMTLGIFLLILNELIAVVALVPRLVRGAGGIVLTIIFTLPLSILVAHWNLYAVGILIDNHEHLSAPDAFKAAYSVVRKNWMHVLGYGLMIAAIAFLAAVPGLLFMLASRGFGIFVIVVAEIFISPMLMAALAFLYHALVGITGCPHAADFGTNDLEHALHQGDVDADQQYQPASAATGEGDHNTM